MIQLTHFRQLSKFFLPAFILTLAWFTLTTHQVYAAGTVTDCTAYDAPGTNDLANMVIGGGIITFNCGGTNAPATIIVPEITITSTTQILGGEVITLSGNFNNRIFNVTSSSFIIDGLTLINGKAASFGGAISVDTANGTTLTIIKSTLYNNSAKDYGGAIYFQPTDGSGNLIINQSSLISNSAGTDSGGAIYLINSHLTINNNSLLSQNKVTNNDGGAILAFAGPGNIKNVIIDSSIISQNSTGDEGGGLMLATGGNGVLNVNITNSQITSNTSEGSGGGGIRSRSKNIEGAVNLTITNSEVSFNKATSSSGVGGAISVDQGVSTIDSTDLISNTAQAGGGLSIEGGTITVTNGSLISQNQAQNGAGVSVTAGRLTVNNSTIANNQAQLVGGGLVLTTVSNIHFTATQLTLSNNSTVSGDGGGLYAEGTNDLVTVNATLNNSTISNNIAGSTGSGNGGGLNIRRGTVTLMNTTVSNNTAKVNGGGLYLGHGGTQQLVVNAHISGNSFIDGNKATTGFGGGIGVQAASSDLTTLINLAITTTTFSNNQAVASNGGGLAINMAEGSAAKISVNGATFSTNQAQLSGGGIFINRPGYNTTQLNLLNNSLIDNNSAISANGGGLGLQASEAGNLIVATDKITISNNKSISGTGGGLSILVLGNSKSNTTISNTTISTNQANVLGGGGFYHQRGAGFNSIYNNTSLLTIRNSTIDNNSAGSSGGGGFWSTGSGSSPATISIINTTISSNKTQGTGRGGGLQIDKGTVSILHATIYTNSSANRGGGLQIANLGNVTIQGSILAGNVAPNARDCNPVTTLTSNDYNFLGNSKDCLGIFIKPNDIPGPDVGIDVIVDPKLSPLATNNNTNGTRSHALLATSPAVDAIKPLNSSVCPISTVNNQDQRGIKRPSGLGCDMGAYEYQGPAAFTITKVASTPLIRGAKFTYTINVLNVGSLPAINVVLTDTLPAGVNFISASNGGNSLLRWIIPSVADGETITRTITVSSCLASVTNNNYRVDGTTTTSSPIFTIGPALSSTLVTPTTIADFVANPLGLSLSVSDQSSTDGSPIVKWVWSFGDGITATGKTASHDYATAGLKDVTLTVTDSCNISHSLTRKIQIGERGLQVTLASSQNPIFPNTQLTYSIFITSTGLLTVSNIDVSNLLPPEVTFVPGSITAQTSGGLVGTAPPNLAFSLVLSPGRVARITYTVLVKNSLPNNWPVTNLITITSPDLSDPVTATVVNTVVATNAMSLSKQVSSDNIAPNNLLTYTINYTVSGNAPFTNITIRDQIPDHTQFVSASLNGTAIAAPTGNVVTWAVGNALVATSGTQTGVAKLTVRVSTPLTNGVMLLNTATMTSSENSSPLQATTTTTVKSSYTLQLSKAVEPRIVMGGQLLTYTIYYTALGNATANQVLLIDAVPDRTTFISATNQPVIEPVISGTGTIVWAVGNILTAGSGITQASGKVSLIVKANNSLANGATIINSAEINSDEQPISTKASARAVAANAELAVEKTTSTPSVIAGRVANYTIILRNAGNVTATNVFVRDILPTGFTYSATVSINGINATRTITNNPTFGATTPRWDTWTIAPQGEVEIVLQTQVDRNIATGIYSNTIERGSKEATYAALTGLAAVKVDQFPEFLIEKKATPALAIAGGVATYTVVIRNIGTASATGVKLNDVLPTGFSYKSTLDIVEGSSVSRETSNNPVAATTKPIWGNWAIPVNGVLTVTYTVDVARSVPADIYQNSATVQANQTIAGVKPIGMADIEIKRLPELFINKTTSSPVIIAGEMATYTISVFNFGTASATRVVVSDILPSNFKYRASTFATASATRVLEENPRAGDTALLWRGWTIESGGALTITFTADVANSAPDITYNNTGYATSEQTGQVDDDPLFGGDANTLPGDTAEDENVTVTHFPLLALEYDGPTLVAAGRTVTYTLIIRNIGSSNANRVALTQVLPSGFSYSTTLSIEEVAAIRRINLNPSPNQSELVWGEWLMAINGVVTITYLVDIPTTVTEGSYTTTLNLGSSNATAINQEHVIEVTRRPILTLNKIAMTPIVAKGELATYQIMVQNEGIIEATNVIITDILPAGGFSYRDTLTIDENLATRTKISNPVDDSLSPEWSAWTIEPGGSVIITFRADVLRFVEDNSYDNAIMVSSEEGVLVQNDGTTNTNDNVIVGLYPLLSLSKNTSTPEVNAGGLANYTIVVNNIGTGPATEVVITDTLPSGFTYLNTTKIEENLSSRTNSVNPTVNSSVPVWGAWTIERNGAVTITLVAQITTTLTQGSYTNTAIAGNNEVNQLPDRHPIDNIQVRVGPRKLAQTYLPIIVKQPSTLITPTPTATTNTPIPVTPTPTATPPTPSPVIAPDLIVERLVATSKFVQLVIKNQGNAPVTNEFWVDFYVDPNPPPTKVNEGWYENNRSEEGIAWGITSSALPINPNDVLILTFSVEPGAPNLYADPNYSRYLGKMAPGTPVYAQVDSVNTDTTYGGVLETHEILLGEPYNNITLSQLSTSDTTPLMEVQPLAQPIHPDTTRNLPKRP